MVVCEFSDSGKGVKDFLDTVRQRDEANETNVAARTKGVVLCSPERAKLLRESGEYEKEGIEIQEVDVSKPETIRMPDNTMVACLMEYQHDGTHQLIRLDDKDKSLGKKDVRDVKITTPSPALNLW